MPPLELPARERTQRENAAHRHPQHDLPGCHRPPDATCSCAHGSAFHKIRVWEPWDGGLRSAHAPLRPLRRYSDISTLHVQAKGIARWVMRAAQVVTVAGVLPWTNQDWPLNRRKRRQRKLTKEHTRMALLPRGFGKALPDARRVGQVDAGSVGDFHRPSSAQPKAYPLSSAARRSSPVSPTRTHPPSDPAR